MYRNTSRKKLKRQTKIRTIRIHRTGSAMVSNYKLFFLFPLQLRNHFRQKLLKTHLFESQILLDVSARSLCVTLKRKNCFTKFMQNENFGSQKKNNAKDRFRSVFSLLKLSFFSVLKTFVFKGSRFSDWFRKHFFLRTQKKKKFWVPSWP